MLKIKRVITISLLVFLASIYTPQAMAGDMLTPPVAGEISTPGLYGEIPNPPGVTGDIGAPGLNGWMSTGLYAAIISFFG